MFGFLRPGCSGARYNRYRQVYAAICAHQRAQYGQLSSLVNSYEANFLYHLAIESGACDAPHTDTPRCCGFRSNRHNRWGLDLELAEFCTAFAVMLVAVKIEDDLRDGKAMLPKFVSMAYRNKFKYAEEQLNRFAPGLSEQIRANIAAHLKQEIPGRPVELDEYVQPTSDAFAAVFEAFGTLCARRGGTLSWSAVGDSVGAAIIAADCAFDFERDRARKEFNPLPSRSARLDAVTFARKSLAKAGWLASRSHQHLDSVSTYVVRSSFDRLSMFARRLSPKANTLPNARRGECDCACDACCELGGCCAQGLDVLNCFGEGANCCANAGGGGIDCCANGGGGGHGGVDCHGGCCPCDICCWEWGSSHKKKDTPEEETDVSPPIQSSIGHECETISTVDPFGLVLLGGLAFPAKSHRPIAKHSKVRVTEADAFGLTVCPAL